MTRSFGPPPDLAEIDALARRALAALPDDVRALVSALVLRVEDVPDEATLAVMELDSPFDLAGLYRGVPLTEKSLADPAPLPDMIFLYRRAILDWWAEEEIALEALVLHLVVHEIGHHFGFSDADMERIEALAAAEMDEP